MLVATFGPTTGWTGRTIAFYDGRFTLEGHGLITAQAVLEYDRQGYLQWAYDGLREWVYSLAPPPAAPAAPVAQAATYPPSSAAYAAQPGPVQAAPVQPAPQAEAPAFVPPIVPFYAGARAESAERPVTPAADTVAPAPPEGEGPDVVVEAAAQPLAADAPSSAAPASAPPAATIAQDVWRAHCLDFDARVLVAIPAASAPGVDVLARAARCVCWDFGPGQPDERRRAFTLYDCWGAEIHTSWARPEAALPESGSAPVPTTPAGWQRLDAPWAAMSAAPGFVGGEPESAGQAAAVALQGRGPDWAAWAGEWLTPVTTMYASSRGQLAALLFAVDAGAASLEDAACAVLVRQELDARHSEVTLQWNTDDLARRMSVNGSTVESVAYGTLGGWQASRVVAESPATLRYGPRRVHVVRYIFMDPPHLYSLEFTVASAAASRLGQADRCAATFVFKG